MDTAKVKVFHIIVSPAIGGAERLLLTLARKSNKSKFEFVLGIFTHEKNEILLQEARRLRLVAEPIKIKNAYDITQITNLYRAIRKHRPHIIHTHGYKSNILGFCLARLLNIPTIATFHGWGTLSKPTTRFFYEICLKLLPHFDLVIAVSKNISDILKKIGVSESKIRIVQNIPSSTPDKSAPVGKTLRDKLGIPPPAKIIGFIGRLEPIKGCSLFLDAAAIVAQRNPNIYFLIVGDGSERSLLEHQVQQYMLKRRVLFCGFHANISMVFAMLDLYVLSSLNEGIPLTLLEAMAHGIPVVATCVGGVPEVIHHEVNGLLVSPDDPIALAESMMESLMNHTATKERIREARNLVNTEYAVDKWVTSMETIYGGIMKGTAYT